MTVATALRRTGAASTGPPTFTNTIAAYWASDPLWSNPGDGNAVSSWRDYSGNTRDATQGNGTLQPIYRATGGPNSLPCVEMDATNDYLAATVPDTAVPFSLILVGNVGAASPPDRAFLMLTTGTATPNYFYVSTYAGASKGWALFRTAGGQATGVAADTSPLLAVGVFNGASSKIITAATTYSPKNPGTGNSGTTLTIGNAAGGTAAASKFSYVAMTATDVTADANWASFKSWVTTTYGLTT